MELVKKRVLDQKCCCEVVASRLSKSPVICIELGESVIQTGKRTFTFRVVVVPFWFL